MRIFSISLMGCFTFSLFASTDVGLPDMPDIREVSIAAEHVFVPKGFDSNDNSEVVATGWYPNPCYEWSRAVVRKNQDAVHVDLKAFIKEGTDMVCIDMAVPYMETVKLGALKAGNSELLVGHLESKVEVTKANSNSIDDYLYGQVRSVRSEKGQLVIDLERPSDCIELDRLQTVFNGKDVCSVLPIMKKIKEVCPRNPVMDTHRLDISEECKQADKVLFHVRSLEGKAVNFLLRNR